MLKLGAVSLLRLDIVILVVFAHLAPLKPMVVCKIKRGCVIAGFSSSTMPLGRMFAIAKVLVWAGWQGSRKSPCLGT